MKIAMVGTRGAPARYGGFETAVEEIGSRLVDRGHDVLVYCRNSGQTQTEHRGMRLVNLPALRVKQLETLSHTAMSTLHLPFARADVAVVFNAANSPFVPVIRALGVPVALHMDGLEWKRAKWSGMGHRYYRWAERVGVRHADELIADARGIEDYYRTTHGVDAAYLPYGAPLIEAEDAGCLAHLGLVTGEFHLVVARFEAENNVELILSGYTKSDARFPLVVVGGAPYGAEHVERIKSIAAGDERIRLVGGIWDRPLLDQLYAHTATYLHGHSVGGTNPSLLRAVGAGAPVVAYDVVFNREVIGDAGEFFWDEVDVAESIERHEVDADHYRSIAAASKERVRDRYDWDQVAAGYETLCAGARGPKGTRPMTRVLDAPVVAPTCVLTLHRVVDGVGSDHDISSGSFRRLIDSLDGIESIADLGHPALERSALVLTFDDGTNDHWQIARSLADRGRFGVFFVTAGLVDAPGYLTRLQLRDMQSMGHVIGSHALRHRLLPPLSVSEQIDELVGSRRLLEQMLEAPVRWFAPPCGATSARLESQLMASGYSGCRAMRWGVYHRDDQRWSIPCIPVTEATMARGWVDSAIADRRLPITMRVGGMAKHVLTPGVREWLRHRALPRGINTSTHASA